MTVCIAAMAENGKAMVLCADRQRTQGAMRHEGRLPKKREIGYGWCFLYEDNGTRADTFRDETQDRLRTRYGPRDFPPEDEVSPQEERIYPMTAREIIRDVQVEFVALRDATLHRGVLDPEAKALDLGLLVVGFDENGEAAGIEMFANGDYESIREVGYGVIGEGEDVASATLAHYGTTMDDPLDHVLYKVYEAKRRADKLITSVGAATDMWIMTDKLALQHQRVVSQGQDAVVVPQRILQTLGQVFEWRSVLPWNVPDQPSSGYWKETLAMYCAAVMRGERPT